MKRLRLIVFGCLVLSALYFGVNSVAYYHKVSVCQKQLETIDRLTAEYQELQTELSNSKDMQSFEVTGISTKRVEIDKSLVEDFLTELMSWKGSKDYNTVRSEIMSKYSLKSNERFTTVFLPAVLNDSTGGGTSFIREGTYLQRVSLYPLSADGGVYHYASVVNWCYYNVEGRRLLQTSLLYFSTREDKTLFAFDAYSVPY